jgi:nucleoside-diphosphate-sugar epimerase
VLGPDYGISIQLVQPLMDRAIQGCPCLSFGIVDVRDVADLHLRAMTNPAGKGEQFLAVASEFMSIQEIALVLKARMGEATAHIPTKVLPDWVVQLVSLFDPASNEAAIVANAEKLPRLGLFRNQRKAA